MKRKQMLQNSTRRTIRTIFHMWFLVLSFTCMMPDGLYAREVPSKVSISVEDERLENVLEEMHKQTNFNFIYNDRYLENLGPITVELKEAPLHEALDKCLKDSKLTYEIQNGIVVLVPEKARKASPKPPKKEVKPIKVSGIVIDEKGIPLPGVTVMVKGTQVGLSTGLEGHFEFEVKDPKAILRFSFIGMETREIAVSKISKGMKVVLKEKTDNLDEVVVTGYVQTTKRKITGSVAVINKQEFMNKPIASVDHILQGQVAGVNSTVTSGRPGETAKIRIRGTNTITGNADPLWVVDGVPLQNDIPKISTGQIKSGDFNDIFTNGIAGINPNDIENVTILKDASAAAIYGSRAAGGVIVITTKKGKAGKMQVSYSSNLSIVFKPQRDANIMNSKEKLAWEQTLWDEFSAEKFRNGEDYPVVGIVGMIRSGKEQFAGMSKAEQDATINELGENSTDWFDELFRNSVSSSHYLSLSGGKDNVTYYLSLGASDNKGLVQKTDYSRYNVNAKINMKPSEKMNVGVILDMAKQESNGPSMNVNPFNYAYFANPYERAYNEDGSYRADFTYYSLKRINGGYDVPMPPNGFNILREIDQTSSKAENLSANLRASMQYHFNDKLSFSGMAAYSFTNNKTDNINGKDTYAAFQDRLYFDSNNFDRTYGSITQTSANNYNYNLRGQFSYHTSLGGEHKISVLMGSEIRGSKAESIYAKRYGYDPVSGNSSIPIPQKPAVGDKIDYNMIKSYADMVDGLSGQFINEDTFASFYSSLDYYFSKKYALSTSFRIDGSNNFGSDEQFNPTWSLGGAWHISEEYFMENLQPVISRLSLKLATGYTGNINKSVSPQLIMNYNTSFRKTDKDVYRMGSIGNAPNPNLRWEKTRDMKVGLDFGLFNNRITGLAEAYYRLSTDVVSQVSVSTTTGFSSQGFNTSSIENKGVEFTLSTMNVKTEDFQFRSSVNIAWNQNKLKEYEVPEGTVSGNNYVGYPLGSVFAGKMTGIDPETGLYTFKLRPDAEINSQKDLTNSNNYLFYLGTSSAPVTGGFSLSFSYKRLSLNMGGSYSLGAKILNNINPPVGYGSLESKKNSDGEKNAKKESIPTYHNDLYVSHLNVSKDLMNRWTANNPTSVAYPRIMDVNGERFFFDMYNPTSSIITKGALLEDVSFLRLRSISLSYSLPDQFLRRYGISSAGLSFSLNNFFTWTNYSGIDPETPGAVYPITRSMSMGLNIGF